MTQPASAANPASGSGSRAELILAPYIAPVYSLCFRLLNDATAAEDAAQETFLDAVKIWDRFVPPAPVAEVAAPGAVSAGAPKDPRLQWLLAIAARRALNLRRQALRFNPASVLEPAMEPSHEYTPSVAAEQAETARRLDAALRELPAEERQAIVLHHVAGLTQAEIAETLALPPRTVSHRISDGLNALRARLERPERPARPARPLNADHAPLPLQTASVGPASAPPRRTGAPEIASLGLILASLPALPTLPPPAGFAAKLLAHPTLLTWSASSTAATASTATAGQGGTTAGSVSTTTATKGATIMSSKLLLAAGAAVLATAFVAWSTGALDPAPRPANAGTARPTLATLATAESAHLPSVPAPVRPVADGPVSTQEQSPAPTVAPTPVKRTPAELEAAFASNLTAEQAATRTALLKSFAAPLTDGLPPNQMLVDTFGLNANESFDVHTSIGMFHALHLFGLGTAKQMNRLQLESPATGPVVPFEWKTFKVDRAISSQTESNPVAAKHQFNSVTSSGRRLTVQEGKPQNFKIDPAASSMRLFSNDVWPAVLPVQYDAKTVLNRVGLALVEPTDLLALLAKANQADAAFLTSAQAWQAALTASDHKAIDQAGAATWLAANALNAAQQDVCVALQKYLEETQSGSAAWSLFTASGGGISLPGLAVEHSGYTMIGGSQANDASSTKESLKADSFKLEVSDETLAHLADVINQNPAAGGSVILDAAIAKLTVAGTLTGTSLEAMLNDVAKLAKVDCKADGTNRWKLVPKPVPGTPGEGF